MDDTTTSRPLGSLHLVRRRDDRVLAGVAASLARATDTDPVIWRVAFAVLTIFGGTGLLLYAAGWLLIPEEGQPESTGERLLRTRGRDLSTPLTVALVVVAAVVVAGVVGDGIGLVPLAVLGVLGYVVWRRRRDAADEEAARRWAAAYGPGQYGGAPPTGPAPFAYPGSGPSAAADRPADSTPAPGDQPAPDTAGTDPDRPRPPA